MPADVVALDNKFSNVFITNFKKPLLMVINEKGKKIKVELPENSGFAKKLTRKYRGYNIID